MAEAKKTTKKDNFLTAAKKELAALDKVINADGFDQQPASEVNIYITQRNCLKGYIRVSEQIAAKEDKK